MNYQCQSKKSPISRCETVCCCEQTNECVNEKFVEPILQAYIKKPDLKSIYCLSNKCDNCLNEYFEKSLRRSHYQAFHEQKDTFDIGRPTAIVSSPAITISDEQMTTMQDEAIEKLQEIRKRYALMQMDDRVFLIGGYIVDSETGEKTIPKHDYFYDNTNKKLVAIPPLPGNGRMGFGLAATDDNKIIIVGGHNFDFESMSNVTMLDTQAEEFKWQNLPDMPNGTIGPGVSVIDNNLYVIGGFDFIGHEILCHGDVLLLNLDEKQWKTLIDIHPPRARPLISIIDHVDPPALFIAGGYNFDKKGKVVPYGKIEEYNRKKKTWQVIANIPNFKTSNGLATKNHKLLLMDTIPETGENQIIKKYNFATRQWQSSHDLRQSSIHRLKKGSITSKD